MAQRTMLTGEDGSGEQLLTPREAALLFRVDPKTVTRWAKAGRLSSIRTIGGHRRYLLSEVEQMLQPERAEYGPISRGSRQ